MMSLSKDDVIGKNIRLLSRALGILRPASSTAQTTSNRAMNFLWSLFNDENNEKYCYHVNE